MREFAMATSPDTHYLPTRMSHFGTMPLLTLIEIHCTFLLLIQKMSTFLFALPNLQHV